MKSKDCDYQEPRRSNDSERSRPRVLSGLVVGLVVLTSVVISSTAPARVNGPADTSAYTSTVLADSPSGYWRLGETSGTSAADSAGTSTGTITGGVTLGTAGALLGDSNTAMTFNGSNGYVSVPSSAALNPTGDLTVEAWVKPAVLNGVGGAVVHKGAANGYSVWQYRLSLTSGNKWRGTVFIASNAYTVTDPGTPSTSSWTHLAMTRSGSTLTLYVNGSAVATGSASGTLNSTTGILAVGRTGASSSDYFNGSIDEVAVYPTALSASPISGHFLAGRPSPVADFSASPTSGSAPLAVSFTDQSTNSPTSWAWNFGDGTTSTAQNPAHTYNQAGTYTVSLTATNSAGSNTVTKTGYITVTALAPVANFSGTPTTGPAPLAVSFTDQSTNSPTSWAWDFGDGTTSTAQNPAHTYNQAGTYTVSLTATNSAGSNTVTKTGYITVTALAPVANFSGTPTTGPAPLAVSFTDQSTNSPTSWAWDFGDGTTSTAQNPAHTYNQAGTYTVSLTATNSAGSNTVTKTGYITVTALAPVANFSGTPTTGPAPLAVSFTDQSTNSPTSWAWDFGDGTTSTAQNPAHTYNQAGTYTVSLTATNSAGSNTVTKTGYITVTALAPVANFSGTPTTGPAPLAVSFTDQSTNSPTSWAWDFGDGTTSTAQNPAHTYNQAGTYTVSLTATNSAGSNTVTKTGYITVTALAPVANFSGTPTTGPAPLAVSFTDQSTNSPTSWAWDFGDGTTSTAQNPAHTYNQAGTYTVSLTATNSAGSNTVTKTGYITVTALAPVANFSGTPTTGPAPLAVSFTDQSTNSPTSWAWDFGDGTTSTAQNPAHTYNQAGTYTVSLTATNSAGSNTVTKTGYITVTALVANFSGTPTTGPAPLAVSFTDQSTNSPTSWAWDFGDGTTSTAQNPAHTYNQAGTYTVSLTATNTNGSATKMRSQYIAVSDPVLVGAGDIADCSSSGDEATAALVSGIPGTVYTIGDNVYDNGTAAEFANCYNPSWGQFKQRTHPVVGNHDYLTSGASGYYGYFGAAAGDPSKGYYSYDLGSWHIVVLNSECSFVGGCGAGSAQELWLKSDLAAHPATCTLAMWHKPRFSSGASGNLSAYTAFWQDLYDAGSDVVLVGHDHDYERFGPQTPSGAADPTYGIREFVVGTGGKSLTGFNSPAANSVVRNFSTYGVMKLTLHATSYDWQFMPVAGGTFTDSGTATCVGAPAPPPPPPPTVGPYSTEVLSDSPAAYWRLGEASGTSAADSSGTNVGTITGGATLGVPGALLGDANTAVTLNGTSGYVNVPSSPALNATGDLTVEVWVKPTAVNGRAAAIVHKGGTSGNSVWQYRLSLTSGNKWRGTVYIGNSALTVTDPGTPSTTTWTHVVMTRSGSVLTLYVNGVAVATASASGTLNSTTNILAIGRTGNAASDYFNGSIDEVAVYATALSAARINAHYLAGTTSH